MRLPLLILTGVLSMLACLPLNDPANSGNSIYVSNFMFSPVLDSGTADKNDSLVVTFRWADSASGIGHTIVWDGGPSLPSDVGLQYSGTHTVVLVPGRYTYHCSVHTEFGMAGVIDVIPFDYVPPTAGLSDPKQAPVPALVTQPTPAVAPESPRRAVRRSQPATS